MAKLVEILARELEEWPKAVGGDGEHPSEAMAQDGDGCLVRLDYLAVANPGQFNGEDWSRVSWCGLGHYPELADDHATAIVTRAEWQAAVDALKPDAQRFAEDYVEANKDRYAKEWNGEGLPPVGLEVECTYSSWGYWLKGKVLCYGQKMIFMEQDSSKGDGKFEGSMNPDGIKFRPIRTPEQIVAEERSEAIMAILDDLSLAVDNLYIAERVYNKGYRKQEPK